MIFVDQCVLKVLMERSTSSSLSMITLDLHGLKEVAIACYTQNRSVIRLHHGKTPYELLHDKLPDLSFFHVFGALCYPTNDRENLGKLQPKADIGFVPNPPPLTSFVPPSRTDWDLLFQPLFDELLTLPPSVDHPAPEVIALIPEVVAPEPAASNGSPSSTTVDQDTPSPSNSQTTPETQFPIIPNDVEEDNHDLDVAHMNNDPFFGFHKVPEHLYNKSKYASRILKKYGMESSDPVDTPMVEKSKLVIEYTREKTLVSWSSKRQKSVAISSTEAEYIDMSGCCAQILWMRSQLTDYGLGFNKIPIFHFIKGASWRMEKRKELNLVSLAGNAKFYARNLENMADEAEELMKLELVDLIVCPVLSKGASHSYQNCPATNGNVYRDNIQEYVTQAAAANFNQGNTGYRAPIANQIRPPGFPPVQQNQGNNQNRYNQNRGNNYNQASTYQPPVNQGQIYRPPINQTPVHQAPPYQAPAPQTQGVTKNDFESYVKANDAVMRNMQDQNQNLQNQMTNLMDMLSKFVNSNTASTSGSGTLPSNTITNPKVDLKGITTRSGVAYQGPTIPTTTSSPPKVVERETEVTKDTVPPTNNGSTKDVQPPVV
ncbi:hypothetical protein Tco_0644411 [Tanacetum coccineum]